MTKCQFTTKKNSIKLTLIFNDILLFLVPTSGEDLCKGIVYGQRITYRPNPNKYLVCLRFGQFKLMSCPSNLVFNEIKGICDYTLNTQNEDPCLNNNNCLNGGICQPLSNFNFGCQCKFGFNGDRCEKKDPCAFSSCGPNGKCIPTSDISSMPYYCLCFDGVAYGKDCLTSFEPNPCLSKQNGLENFPSQMSPSLFVSCQYSYLHLKSCSSNQLVYNHQLQICDWKNK